MSDQHMRDGGLALLVPHRMRSVVERALYTHALAIEQACLTLTGYPREPAELADMQRELLKMAAQLRPKPDPTIYQASGRSGDLSGKGWLE